MAVAAFKLPSGEVRIRGGPDPVLAALAEVNVADRCGCDVCRCCGFVVLVVGGEEVVVGDSKEYM